MTIWRRCHSHSSSIGTVLQHTVHGAPPSIVHSAPPSTLLHPAQCTVLHPAHCSTATESVFHCCPPCFHSFDCLWCSSRASSSLLRLHCRQVAFGFGRLTPPTAAELLCARPGLQLGACTRGLVQRVVYLPIRVVYLLCNFSCSVPSTLCAFIFSSLYPRSSTLCSLLSVLSLYSLLSAFCSALPSSLLLIH